MAAPLDRLGNALRSYDVRKIVIHRLLAKGQHMTTIRPEIKAVSLRDGLKIVA
jgi:hypothetical protein